MKDRDILALTALALQTAPQPVRDYCAAVMLAASSAHFKLQFVGPEFGQPGCYMMMMPGGVFRHGERTKEPIVSLVQVLNEVRGDLVARGHKLPDRIEVEAS